MAKSSRKTFLERFFNFMAAIKNHALSVVLANGQRTGGVRDLDNYAWTPTRIFGVIRQILMLKQPSDAARKDTKDHGYSAPYSYVLLGVGGVAFILGMVRRIYQIQHEAWKKSFGYFRKRVLALSDEKAERVKSINEEMKTLKESLKKKAIEKKYFDDEIKKNKDQLEAIDADIQAGMGFHEERIRQRAQYLNYEAILKETKIKKREPNGFVRFVTQVDDATVQVDSVKSSDGKKSAPGPWSALINYALKGLSTVWNELNNSAYFYWAAVMVLMIPFGFLMAVNSPIAVLIAIGLTGFFVAVKAGFAIGEKLPTTQKNEGSQEEDEGAKEEKGRQLHAAKLRYALREHHASWMRKILQPSESAEVEMVVHDKLSKEDKQKKRIEKYEAEKKKQKKLRETYISKRKTAEKAFTINRGQVRDSKLYKELVGTTADRNKRKILHLIDGFLGGIIATSFVLWFVSATGGLVLAPVLSAGALNFFNFIGANWFGAALGAPIGLLFSIREVAQLHKKQLDFQNKVEAVLSARYSEHEDITVYEKFDRLSKLVVQKGKDLERQYGPKLKEAMGEKNFQKHWPNDEKKLMAYNDRYFNNFQEKTPKGTTFKKIASRFDVIFSAAGSGVFLSRLLLLATGVGAIGLITGLTGGTAMIVFFALTAAFAVGYAVTSYYKMKYNREQEKKEKFIDHIHGRIDSLKYEFEKLLSIEDKLKQDQEVVAEKSPDPEILLSIDSKKTSKKALPKRVFNLSFASFFGSSAEVVGRSASTESAPATPRAMM